MMKNRQVVITGKGVISPGGFTVRDFWDSILNKKSHIKKIRRFNTQTFPSKAGGVIESFDRKKYKIKKYIADQMDISSIYGLVTADLAYTDAGADAQDYDPRRIGVFYGTNLGGRSFAEKELYNLYTKGPDAISPYQAIADFNAATVGQISIRLGIKGNSKTFATDLSASHDAIIEAYQSIHRGDSDLILTGGVESIFSGFGFLCALSSGLFSSVNSDFETAYRPFDQNRTGMFGGEGSAFVMLEDRDHAKKRGRSSSVEIKGYARTSCGKYQTRENKIAAQARVIRNALDHAEVTPEDITCIKACGFGTREEDFIEAKAIQSVFSEIHPCLPVTAPHSGFGHMQGAMGAFDLLIAALSIEDDLIPPTPNYRNTDIDHKLNIVTAPIKTKVKCVVILGMGNGGVYQAIVAGKTS